MTNALITPVAALSGVDILGIVVSFAVCVYLVYALLRAEDLLHAPEARAKPVLVALALGDVSQRRVHTAVVEYA